jgi:thioesterase domain-containing protein
MARQLKAMGKKVDKLILFDTAAFEEPGRMSVSKRIGFQIKKRITDFLFLFKEPKGFFDLKKRSFTRKKDKLLVLLKMKHNPDILNDHSSIIKRIVKNNAGILDNYVLPAYPGKIYLFKAKHRYFYVEDPVDFGWKALGNQVETVNVSGHHDNIFVNPRILAEMAEKIQKVLDEKTDN